ncbi:Uncharacterized conserved protein PhnB, glyoxalase superfamily [Streptomyces zhaozhouensis]|uniref:Uncharacterized conserved protein PhnB, glyoxalase superfamily n=1 Tax=Streptomyces zhaozhouensis TaxID=1300267 RepID=A0A286E6X0_9ACTN|nr:VOC family protein [Streptomyces zhaozhouensis]SOD66657.1 Uncharacterized conserved protein PhnB, glyoxalase superfamily [Streptomyces zhaozhouensis]
MSDITSLLFHSVYVLDQDEALDFYVGKLGFEVQDDIDMGFMRWLTIRLPKDPERAILLEVPGGPGMSEEAAAQLRGLITQGAMGAAGFFGTDDVRGLYERLVDAGVEITQKPEQQPYGIDIGIRDPFGNHLRITQPTGRRDITDDDLARWGDEGPA